MSVDELYQLAQFISNKNQNGYISPEDFNLLINQAQTSFLDYLLGEFQQYQYGKSKARVEYSQNANTRNRLQPLIYNYNLTVNSNGFVTYPSDFIQTDAMWTYYGNNRVRYVQQDRLWSVYNSKIDPVSANPIYLLEQEGYQFYPSSIANARLSYIKNPTRIYWAYTLDANGRPVYDASRSEQPVWYDVDLLEILARVLKMVGVSLKDGEVAQYAESIKNGGQ